MSDKKIDFTSLGGKEIHTPKRKKAIDFSSVGGKKIGTVSDLFKKLYGEHGSLIKSAVPKEDPDGDE